MTKPAKKLTDIARKPGGQPGNRNNLRHGLRGIGKLPDCMAYLEHQLNNFRRQLEDAVMLAKGDVNITDASLINSALKWEYHGRQAQRWLAQKADELSPDQQLRFSAEVAKASDARDKAIRALNLDAPPEAPTLSSYLEGKVV